jgi:hypothetical protein
MPPFLHAAERDGYHHLVVSDELWFFLDPLASRMSTLSREDVIINPKDDLQSKKYMSTII